DASGWRNPQTLPNGNWSGWQVLDSQSLAGPLSIAQNIDGRLEVFAITPDGDLVHTWQQSANQWTWPGPDFASAPQINPGQGPGLLLTQHANSARSGWTPFETALNVDN